MYIYIIMCMYMYLHVHVYTYKCNKHYVKYYIHVYICHASRHNKLQYHVLFQSLIFYIASEFKGQNCAASEFKGQNYRKGESLETRLSVSVSKPQERKQYLWFHSVHN